MSESTPIEELRQAATALEAGRVKLATARGQEDQARSALSTAEANTAAAVDEQNALQADYDVKDQAVRDSAPDGTGWASSEA